MYCTCIIYHQFFPRNTTHLHYLLLLIMPAINVDVSVKSKTSSRQLATCTLSQCMYIQCTCIYMDVYNCVFFCGPNVTLSSCSWLGYYKLCALLSTLLNGFRGWVMVTVLEKGPLCACSSTLYSLAGKCLCIIIMCNNTYIILTKNVCI